MIFSMLYVCSCVIQIYIVTAFSSNYSDPMLICVTSVAHLRFGADAAKSRLMMFGAMCPTSPLYER